MNKYILLKNVRVQNANAVAGFTWGFPAITHFLGFTHYLTRKLIDSEHYTDLSFTGCAVIPHKTQVHIYRPVVESPKGSGNFIITEPQFCQSRNPAYQHKEQPKYKVGTPPVIEEGKMNMTVSLLMSYDGYIGQNKHDDFKKWLLKICLLQRLAGGSILDIEAVDIYDLSVNEKESSTKLRVLKRALLPGFVLKERSDYLEDYYKEECKKNDKAEVLDAWLYFITLKQKARPKASRITEYIKNQPNSELIEIWHEHLKQPYEKGSIPDPVKTLFAEVKSPKELVKQWSDYCDPTDKTDADWEYLSKPKRGYLVPIMTGYKAISKPYERSEVKNIRAKLDDKGVEKVCFVESVHSIGEWQSVHRIKNTEELAQCIWKYKPYEVGWYLCSQEIEQQTEINHNDNCSRD